MANTGFLSDFIARTMRFRQSEPQGDDILPALQSLCLDIVGGRDEPALLEKTLALFELYDKLALPEREDFFRFLSKSLCPDTEALDKALQAFQAGDPVSIRNLHFASEPLTQQLLRKLNLCPGGTARIVGMREGLLALVADPELKSLDQDFLHLLSSWFNRGFLQLRAIDWDSPASMLEKIIQYEAVHEINGWGDLRGRVGADDRRLFAYFHPAMSDAPLIFVEVALMREIPDAIHKVIATERELVPPEEATTAVFYSISNCHEGLRGISFGNFLIKQVVNELKTELPQLKTFVTLSPVPGLRRWARKHGKVEALAEDPESLRKLAAYYLLNVRRANNHTHDPVANFHLSNGAQLHAVHTGADLSERGEEISWGVMVNYLYDLGKLEQHLKTYHNDAVVNASNAVIKLANIDIDDDDN